MRLNIDLEENNFDNFLSGKMKKKLKKAIALDIGKVKECGKEYVERVKSGKSKMKVSKKDYVVGCVKRKKMEQLSDEKKEKEKEKTETSTQDTSHLQRYTNPISQEVSNEREKKKNKYATLLLAGGALIAVIVAAKFIK